MILHLLKLVWHRKRANALVTVEIFFSFLIVFAVVTLGVSLLSRWTAPLGFSWRNVWVMNVSPVIRQEVSSHRTTPDDNPAAEETRAHQAAVQTDRLLRELKSFPEIEVEALTPCRRMRIACGRRYSA